MSLRPSQGSDLRASPQELVVGRNHEVTTATAAMLVTSLPKAGLKVTSTKLLKLIVFHFLCIQAVPKKKTRGLWCAFIIFIVAKNKIKYS